MFTHCTAAAFSRTANSSVAVAAAAVAAVAPLPLSRRSRRSSSSPLPHPRLHSPCLGPGSVARPLPQWRWPRLGWPLSRRSRRSSSSLLPHPRLHSPCLGPAVHLLSASSLALAPLAPLSATVNPDSGGSGMCHPAAAESVSRWCGYGCGPSTRARSEVLRERTCCMVQRPASHLAILSHYPQPVSYPQPACRRRCC